MANVVPVIPPIPTSDVVATVAGGALWGMARVYVAAFSPTPPRKRDLAAAAVETTFALAAAVIAGLYVSPWVVSTVHAKSDTSGLVSVLVGLGFWQAVPALRAIAGHVLPDRIAVAMGIKPAEITQ